MFCFGITLGNSGARSDKRTTAEKRKRFSRLKKKKNSFPSLVCEAADFAVYCEEKYRGKKLASRARMRALGRATVRLGRDCR